MRKTAAERDRRDGKKRTKKAKKVERDYDFYELH